MAKKNTKKQTGPKPQVDEDGFPVTYRDPEEIEPEEDPARFDEDALTAQVHSKSKTPSDAEISMLEQIEQEDQQAESARTSPAPVQKVIPQAPAPRPVPVTQTQPTPQPPIQEQKPVAGTISQKEAVRLALEHNPNFTAKDGVPWINENYGDQLKTPISTSTFATLKSGIVREGAAGGGTPSASPKPRTPSAPVIQTRAPVQTTRVTAPSTGSPAVVSSVELVRTLKELINQYGPEAVVGMAEALTE